MRNIPEEDRALFLNFEIVTHQIFKLACEREADTHPRLYAGKELAHFTLSVVRLRIQDDPDSLREEVLEMAPLGSVRLGRLLNVHPTGSDHLSVSAEWEREEQARRMDELKVNSNPLHIPTLPIGSVWAEHRSYTREQKHSEPIRVSAFEFPSDIWKLGRALMFARDALSYVISSDAESVSLEEWRRKTTEGGMKHRLELLITPDLSLTGNEPRIFLERYRDVMSQMHRVLSLELESGMPGKSHQDIEGLRVDYTKYGSALELVNRIIENRSDYE